MPDLYISALGVPFRAVVAHAGGKRAFVKFGDGRDNEYALEPSVWIDQEGALAGAAARIMERGGHHGDLFRVRIGQTATNGSLWSERDLLAAIFRRCIATAESQTGEAVTRVIAIVPSTASDEIRDACVQAGMLAGAQAVETLSPDHALAPDEVLVEAWDDRVTLTVRDRSGTVRSVDAADPLSRAGLRQMLEDRFALDFVQSNDARDSIAADVFERWLSGRDVSNGVGITRPVPRATPLTIFVPKKTFAQLDEAVSTGVTQIFAAAALELGNVRGVRVIGSWTRPITAALRTLFGAGVTIRDDRGLELDAAIAALPPIARAAPATLETDIYAVAPSARTLRALSQGEPILLLRAGTRLPATSVSENFASDSFIERFSVAAGSASEHVPMLGFEIPRYAERQPTSYLRAVVHGDTPAFMLIEVAYLYPSRRRYAFFDKARRVEVPIPSHAWSIRRDGAS